MKCYMLSQKPVDPEYALNNSIVLRRTGAIGDSLCATVVADRLIELGYNVSFQSHPANHCVLRRHPALLYVGEPNQPCHVDLDGCYEQDPNRRTRHFHEMFLASATKQLLSRGIALGWALNCKPRILITPKDRYMGSVKLQAYSRPWVFICPRSNSWAARQVPNGIWAEAAKQIKGTCFWLGNDPAPPGLVDLKCRELDNLIVWLSAANLLVSVDTGPLHIGAAMGIPILALGQSSTPELHLSDQRDFLTIEPKLPCLNCQQNICPKNALRPPCQTFEPHMIAQWANARLNSIFSETISAVVSVYRPDVRKLNRCLEALLPQVSEIVVVRDQAGAFPAGAKQDPRIRYITHYLNDVGYGRKINFGARRTNGRWLLFVNDDCYLNPGAVAELRKEMGKDVGIVSPLLRYPDGTIYHAGKVRGPNQAGWGHLDHRKFEPTLKKPTEMENLCGACMLVRRTAFYEAGCFDEDFYLYAEDDALCLSMRRAGYRLVFTPYAIGTHDEGQSTKRTPNIVQIMQRSNALFGQKWGQYLEWNATRIPGNFDYAK